MFEDILTDEVLRKYIIDTQDAVGLVIRLKKNFVESIEGEYDKEWEKMLDASMFVVQGYLDSMILKLNERKQLDEFRQRSDKE